jgi:soluble lytic murein transglycosylase-like protein
LILPPSGAPTVVRLTAAFVTLVTTAHAALAAPPGACLASISRIEARSALPEGLLGAVALTESARRVPNEKRTVPWPWTVNSPAGPFYLESREAAVAKVEALRRAGHRNIDVGCMQINLMHHPDAFASLDEAFDPDANVAYAARFLAALEGETEALVDAVGYYHSRTPKRSRAYARKVYTRWGRPLPAEADPPVSRGKAVIYRADADAPGGWRRESAGAGEDTTRTSARRPKTRRSGFDDWRAGRPPRR